jgi:hypothetical protein
MEVFPQVREIKKFACNPIISSFKDASLYGLREIPYLFIL